MDPVAFQSLVDRVSALEGQWYKFWLPLVVSLGAFLVSLLGFLRNISQSKASTLQNIKNNIDLVKGQLESRAMELAPLKAKSNRTPDEESEFEIKSQVIEAIIERLLNAYNDGCDKFYKNKVSKQDFVDMYDQDIAIYINEFPDKFTPPVTRFDKMNQYYQEYHKQKKA